MREVWLSRGWYIAMWISIFIAARLWLVNPILQRLDRLLQK